MTRRVLLLVLFLVALAAAAASPAMAEPGRRSPHLDRAIAAIDELDYDAARAQLVAALRDGGNRRADTVMIHRLAGEISAAFGHSEEAAARFRLMLAVDPSAEVAEGQAPKVVEPYDQARAFIDEKGALGTRLEREPDGHGGARIIVVVESDPLHMVAGAALFDRDSGRVHRVVKGSDQLELPVSASERGNAVVVLVDQHGNHLTEAIAAAPPSPAPRPRAPTPASAPAGRSEIVIDQDAVERDSGRPIVARWSTWAAAAAVTAGAGIWFGLQARGDWEQLDNLIDDSGAHDYADARAIESRGRRNALIGNLALGTAAACGAVSAVLLIHQLRGDRGRRGLAVTPARGGGTVAMAWEF